MPHAKSNGPIWIARFLPEAAELRKACPKAVPGTPIVEAQLLANGTVGRLRIVKSGGCKAADQLVLDSVKRWTFRPARENGKPVALWLTMTVSIDGP